MTDLPPKLRLTPADIARHKEWVANHPEKKLSAAARQRISDAWDEHHLIRSRADAAIELRWEANPGTDSFGEYRMKGQAWIDFVESRVKAARLVLQTTAEEYWKLNLPKRQYREVMESEIDAMTYSLEFRNHQKLAIETEFGILWAPPPESSKPEVATPAADLKPSRKPGRPAGEFHDSGRRRVEAFFSGLPRQREQLAEKADIESKTIDRLMKGKGISRSSWFKLARAMGITYEALIKASEQGRKDLKGQK